MAKTYLIIEAVYLLYYLIDFYLQTKLVALVREEVDLMYQLDHPNILRLFGIVQEDAQLNVFVEWMAGGSIAR